MFRKRHEKAKATKKNVEFKKKQQLKKVPFLIFYPMLVSSDIRLSAQFIAYGNFLKESKRSTDDDF